MKQQGHGVLKLKSQGAVKSAMFKTRIRRMRQAWQTWRIWWIRRIRRTWRIWRIRILIGT